MDMEVAEEEAFFVNVLVEDGEGVEDLKAIKKREKVESARLEMGMDNWVEERRIIEKKIAMMSRIARMRASRYEDWLATPPGQTGVRRSWTWMWTR